MGIYKLTIQEIREGLDRKKFSSTEIAKAFLTRIKDEDKNICAYLSVDEESAVREAKAADEALSAGKSSPMTGIPIAVKDNILIEGRKATAASRILENYNARYDAGVIRKLKQHKAVFLGKTNLDEFAMGSSTENSAFRITRNPHDLKRVPGGSSGGSVAAVASYLAPGALGSDTGGSIRQPASFCGVVGIKPTYGSVSRFGLMAMASSLDQIGPIAKTVGDAAMLFHSIAGHDPYDATSAETSYDLDSFLNPNLENARKLTVGLPKEYFKGGLDAETEEGINSAIDRLKNKKIRFKEISLPHTSLALDAYYIIVTAEVSANLARFDGIRYSRIKTDADDSLLELYVKQRELGFGPEVKRRIVLGTFVLSSGYYDAYYAKAQKVRRLIQNDFKKAFEEVDVIFTPLSPTVAFKIGEKTSDPLEMYLSDIYTITLNLAGLPGLAVPAEPLSSYYENKKLPVGFQLIGKPFREQDLFGMGQLYEKD